MFPLLFWLNNIDETTQTSNPILLIEMTTANALPIELLPGKVLLQTNNSDISSELFDLSNDLDQNNPNKSNKPSISIPA